MEEKNLEELIYSNVDFAKLNKEHVYIFRFRRDYIELSSSKDIENLCNQLKARLDELGIKYIIIVGDIFAITELIGKKE